MRFCLTETQIMKKSGYLAVFASLVSNHIQITNLNKNLSLAFFLVIQKPKVRIFVLTQLVINCMLLGMFCLTKVFSHIKNQSLQVFLQAMNRLMIVQLLKLLKPGKFLLKINSKKHHSVRLYWFHHHPCLMCKQLL